MEYNLLICPELPALAILVLCNYSTRLHSNRNNLDIMFLWCYNDVIT